MRDSLTDILSVWLSLFTSWTLTSQIVDRKFTGDYTMRRCKLISDICQHRLMFCLNRQERGLMLSILSNQGPKLPGTHLDRWLRYEHGLQLNRPITKWHSCPGCVPMLSSIHPLIYTKLLNVLPTYLQNNPPQSLSCHPWLCVLRFSPPLKSLQTHRPPSADYPMRLSKLKLRRPMAELSLSTIKQSLKIIRP